LFLLVVLTITEEEKDDEEEEDIQACAPWCNTDELADDRDDEPDGDGAAVVVSWIVGVVVAVVVFCQTSIITPSAFAPPAPPQGNTTGTTIGHNNQRKRSIQLLIPTIDLLHLFFAVMFSQPRFVVGTEWWVDSLNR
jgi:hypothetical protein